jgi:outer membrane protein OmpA-like peptidoglycan-associated protein
MKLLLNLILYLLFTITGVCEKYINQNTLHGKVTERYTNKPLYKATIHLVGSDNSNKEFKTDSNGAYYIDSVFLNHSISYTLSCSAYDICYVPVDLYKYDFTTNAQGHPSVLKCDFLMTHMTDCPGGLIRFPRILFENNSSLITQSAKDTVCSFLVKILNDNPNLVIEADGHASQNEGHKAYKISLSLKRAVAFKDYMVLKGIDSLRIKARGWSDKKPIVDLESIKKMKRTSEKDSAYSVNRRVEFRILSFNYIKK